MPRATIDVHEVQLLQSQLRMFKFTSNKAFRDNARKVLIGPVVRDIQASMRAGSPFGKFVAPTVRGVYPTTGYPAIRAGGGVGKGGLLFYGTEFGGGNRMREYTTHSRSGNPYIVRRHTTRQFGYFRPMGKFLYPTVRAHGPRITETWASLSTETFTNKG